MPRSLQADFAGAVYRKHFTFDASNNDLVQAADTA